MTIMVTGGFGFIGSNFIRKWCADNNEFVINIDNCSFASNVDNLRDIPAEKCLTAVADINDQNKVANILNAHPPRAIFHFAAETHVDRSIVSPKKFVYSNFIGTAALLEVVYDYWNYLKVKNLGAEGFRFIHISTDEVYGSTNKAQGKFTTLTPYDPSSPYSATKAGSDHMVRAYWRTYGLPSMITHCSNNYGPRQHPEKFIPTIIRSLMQGKKVPVYGNGLNVRDWIHVDDHNAAVTQVLKRGNPGFVYNIGANCEVSNIDLATYIAKLMGHNPEDVIEYVHDRPGHDYMYSIDNTEAIKALRWLPVIDLKDGLQETIEWYKNEYKDSWNNSVSGEQQPPVSSDVSSNEATPAGLR